MIVGVHAGAEVPEGPIPKILAFDRDVVENMVLEANSTEHFCLEIGCSSLRDGVLGASEVLEGHEAIQTHKGAVLSFVDPAGDLKVLESHGVPVFNEKVISLFDFHEKTPVAFDDEHTFVKKLQVVVVGAVVKDCHGVIYDFLREKVPNHVPSGHVVKQRGRELGLLASQEPF